MSSERRINSWRPDGVPFFWIPKEGFDRIEQGLERGSAASAKLVFVALCLLANRMGVATFSKPINYLATLASQGRRTVERRLTDLQRLGLVTMEREGRGEAYNFTLATLSRHPATLSRQVTTGTEPQAVALPKEPKNARTEGKPSIVERIALERKLQILQRRQSELRQSTAEQWQRDEHPERLAELHEVGAKIKALEDQLLDA